MLKLQKSLRLPNSPLSLRMRYECPLEALDDPFRPPARFMFRCWHALCSVATQPFVVCRTSAHGGITAYRIHIAHGSQTRLSSLGRLDNMTGTGVHLNLQGVNFDQRVISLGKVRGWRM